MNVDRLIQTIRGRIKADQATATVIHHLDEEDERLNDLLEEENEWTEGTIPLPKTLEVPGPTPCAP